jgi:hypothetical protein
MFFSSPTIATTTTKSNGNIFNNAFSLNAGNLNCLGNLQAISNPYFPPNTFSFIFGQSAYQTINSLVINKSELFGLTPNSNNTAESLLVGIINRLLGGSLSSEFPKLSTKYWGYGNDEGNRIDTVVINIRNSLTVTSNEIAEYNYTIDPDSY